MHNGTILHYTRIHPTTGEVFPYYRFMRSVCAWKPEYSSPGWLEFERPAYSNEELMASIQTVPRLVNNKPGEKHEEKDYSDRVTPYPFADRVLNKTKKEVV